MKILEGHTDRVTAVTTSADFAQALSGSGDTTLRLWDLESGACMKILEGHTGWVTAVVASAVFARAFSGSSDHTLRFWDLESGACLKILEGHTGWVEAVAANADFARALSGSWDKVLRLWDLESGQCLATYDAAAPIISLAADFSRGRVICGCSDGQIHFLTIRRGHEIVRMEAPTAGILLRVARESDRTGSSHRRDPVEQTG